MALVPVTCLRCGTRLGETLPSAKVWCEKCRRWVAATEASPKTRSPQAINREVTSCRTKTRTSSDSTRRNGRV